MKEEDKIVYKEFKPESYIGKPSITLHCKKSEYNKYKVWFDRFINRAQEDLFEFNKLIIKGKNKRNYPEEGE